MEDGCAVTQSSCSEATVDGDFLHHFYIISCVKPHYFRSAFRSTFLHSGFHCCPCWPWNLKVSAFSEVDRPEKQTIYFYCGLSMALIDEANTDALKVISMNLWTDQCTSVCCSTESYYSYFVLYALVYLRAIGGEVGATSSLAPKIGPLGLVC